MNAFLWTMLVAFSLDVVARIIWLATGDYPPRTPRTIALDLAINIVCTMWVVLLLARSAS